MPIQEVVHYVGAMHILAELRGDPESFSEKTKEGRPPEVWVEEMRCQQEIVNLEVRKCLISEDFPSFLLKTAG